MTHLTDAEFIDLLDGLLPEARVAHVGGCETCGVRADVLRLSLAQALVDEAREPSPLFWQHFGARVSEAIRHEPAGEPVTWRNWLHNPASRWAAVASVVVLLMVAAAWRATLQAPTGDTVRLKPDTTNETGAWLKPDTTTDTSGTPDDVEADESWAVVRTAAEGIAWEDVQEAGISARPGSADRVALELSVDEREALVRLLQHELKRSGA